VAVKDAVIGVFLPSGQAKSLMIIYHEWPRLSIIPAPIHEGGERRAVNHAGFRVQDASQRAEPSKPHYSPTGPMRL